MNLRKMLYIPEELLEAVEAIRNSYRAPPSRNQWFLDAIEERVKKEEKEQER